MLNPFDTIAFADDNTLSWSMFLAQEFQPFHPIGGVKAMVSPIFIFNILTYLPSEFVALNETLYVPLCETFPVMMPVLESMESPAGNGLAENFIGLSPVAVTVKRNGFPGVAPNTVGVVIFGCFDEAGVRIYLSLSFGTVAGKLVSFIVITAFAQLL